MKTFLCLLFFISSLQIFAASPFQPHDEKRFSEIEANVTALQGNRKYYQRATYTVSSTLAAAATFDFTGISLPAGAIITDAYLLVETQVVSANDNTIAIGCDSSNDLKAAADLTDDTAGTFVAGAITGAAANHVELAAVCVPEGTVGAGASGITAGALTLVVEYLL